MSATRSRKRFRLPGRVWNAVAAVARVMAFTAVVLPVMAGTVGEAQEWRTFQGQGVVVEAPPRYAGLAAGLALRFPDRVAEVKSRLGLAPPPMVRLTVGVDARQLSERLGVDLRPWVAGVALKGRAHIGLNASSLRPPSSLPARVILRHELTHLALGERVGPDRRIPLWLEEGICQWVGGTAYLGVRTDLLAYLNFDDLLSWSDIEERFPGDRRNAQLAYLQSFAFVDYLAYTRGRAFLLQLVDAAAQGVPVHQAALSLTGQAQVDLEKAWMHHERQRSRRLLYLLQALSPLAVAAVLVILAWRRRARVAHFLLQEMEAEENAWDGFYAGVDVLDHTDPAGRVDTGQGR
jgi:peptidase MA superfamily protein